MKSPFYVAEQNALYPHRVTTTNKDEAINHLKALLLKKLITEEYLNNTAIGKIRHEILLNISSLDCSGVIRDALKG